MAPRATSLIQHRVCEAAQVPMQNSPSAFSIIRRNNRLEVKNSTTQATVLQQSGGTLDIPHSHRKAILSSRQHFMGALHACPEKEESVCNWMDVVLFHGALETLCVEPQLATSQRLPATV